MTTLAEVVKIAVARGSSSLRVCMPGRVESFDSSTHLADVKPLLKNKYETATGEDAFDTLPIIVSVPVVMPYATGGMTLPVRAGDECVLVFADRSIDGWLESGTEQSIEDDRQHHLTDCFAIVGAHSQAHKIADYDADRVALGFDGGVKVALTSGQVHLGVGHGAPGSEAAIKGNTYTADEATLFQSMATSLNTANIQLQAIGTALNAIVPGVGASFNTLGATFAGIAGTLNSFAAAQSTRLSTKVKLD